MSETNITLSPVNPMEIITNHDPIPQEVMDTSAWFVTETLEVRVGEAVGRPSKEVQLGREFVAYLLGNGWNITAFTEGGEDGEWTSVSESTASTSSASSNSATGASASNFSSVSNANGSASGTSWGDSTSNGSAEASGSSRTKTEDNGAPYWYAYNMVRLTRRRMKSEAVLADMVRSFTDAYNEGRNVNAARYNELVSLYALMLKRTEDEANAVPVADIDTSDFEELNEQVKDAMRARMDAASGIIDDLTAEDLQRARDQIKLAIDDFKAMYDAAKEAVDGAQKLTMDDFKAMYESAKDAIAGIKVLTLDEIKAFMDAARQSIISALNKFAESIDGLPEGWLDSRTADINRQFDAKIAQARSQMVSAGTYNGTSWTSVESGYERDRQYALNNLVDEIARIKVDTYGKIATITADVESRALDAPLKLADIQRALAGLEADLFNAGTRLADVQNGLAASEARMLDAGMKLADVQNGLANIELNISGEKIKLADANVRMAEAEPRIAEIGQRLLETEVRIADLLNKQAIGKTELRNTVFKWMLEFMERRDDDYPSLETLANAAQNLGFADGGSSGE